MIYVLFPMWTRPGSKDSPAFESDRYVSKFLQEADVVQLIQKDNDLITGGLPENFGAVVLERRFLIRGLLQNTAVKTLDGEMKTLVYENYSKFITATDTIRKVSCSWASPATSLHLHQPPVDLIATPPSR